ncbi:MAG: hypothetical protein AAFV51_14710, partial [Pseudomonadota bacterium]
FVCATAPVEPLRPNAAQRVLVVDDRDDKDRFLAEVASLATISGTGLLSAEEVQQEQWRIRMKYNRPPSAHSHADKGSSSSANEGNTPKRKLHENKPVDERRNTREDGVAKPFDENTADNSPLNVGAAKAAAAFAQHHGASAETDDSSMKHQIPAEEASAPEPSEGIESKSETNDTKGASKQIKRTHLGDRLVRGYENVEDEPWPYDEAGNWLPPEKRKKPAPPSS